MSCDTFVVLPNSTSEKRAIFGKNSDRPISEVQEVVLRKSRHGDNVPLKCTYITIPETTGDISTVILSKPSWMWGAEMGANEHGVVIGNEAVWTKDNKEEEDLKERLLGMDLVRLGLERGKSAADALDVITSLLEQHGQGGLCYETSDGAVKTYFNSFLIADAVEAWVLETVGKQWAAEHITSGYRNISNLLSIGTKIDRESAGLRQYAKDQGYWDGSGDFNFAKIFGSQFPGMKVPENETPSHRYSCGRQLLEKACATAGFREEDMMSILRDEAAGICRTGRSTSLTTASQVSVLAADPAWSHHWFTATPNPNCSVFKPFVFCEGASLGPTTCSPPQPSDLKHALYKAHARVMRPVPGDDTNTAVRDQLRGIEACCLRDVREFLNTNPPRNHPELKELFKDSVETEMKFYK